ncbi:MAG TPA: class I SAM-dependent methyltransferase [Pseudonocardiaceae bacterium]|jgi:SAM-dependent methyltransferase|nr:class I SAM-dependent methyltransferase [Pseudonocardiaceae bacterium]
MTELGLDAAGPWQDEEFVRGWVEADTIAGLLAFPRAVSAALVKQDRPQANKIVDIGSGTGEFLAVFLDEFPDARGVWTDASEAMLDIARTRLAEYGDRVEYQLVDMTDLAHANLPRDIDVVLTSRAAHHLDRPALFDFYREAGERLASGGWLVNLDHIGPRDDTWNQRLRTVRKRFQPQGKTSKPHHHNYPLTGVADHFDALTAAGLTDHEIAWRGLITCLFMARKN